MKKKNKANRPAVTSPVGETNNEQQPPKGFETDNLEAGLLHYTVNSGHTRNSPRSEVWDETIQTLKPIILHGGALAGPKDINLWATNSDGGALFTIWQGGMPLVHCAFAWTEEGEQELWPLVEDLNELLYKGLSDAKDPVKPARLPWLAVTLLPTIALADPELVSMLGDLERCVAWAILEHRSKPAARHVAKLLGQAGGMGCIEPQNGKTFTLAELQACVGGMIEILQPPGTTGAILVINQLGKCLPGLVKNELASRIWQEGSEPGSPRSQDDIVGNAVLCHTTQLP